MQKEKGWEAANALRAAFFQKIRKVDFVIVQSMMGQVKRNLRVMEDNGPSSLV